jgi:polar amino acid transport system substrate-binding protein
VKHWGVTDTLEGFMNVTRFRRTLVLVAVVGLLGATAACGDSVDSDADAATGDGSSSSLPKEIVDRGVLRVATAAAYPPDQLVDESTKEVTGWSPELLREAAKRMGVKVEFTDMEFAGILPGVQSGKFDLGSSSFAVTDERKKAVDFVTYSQTGDTLLVAKGNPKGLDFDSLCGMPVGVTKGSVSDFAAQEVSKKCSDSGDKKLDIQAFPNQNGAILALDAGRVDAVIASLTVNAYLAQQSNNKFDATDKVLSTRTVGYAVKKGSDQLANALMTSLKTMKDDGTYDSILKKWGVEGTGLGSASDFTIVK